MMQESNGAALHYLQEAEASTSWALRRLTTVKRDD